MFNLARLFLRARKCACFFSVSSLICRFTRSPLCDMNQEHKRSETNGKTAFGIFFFMHARKCSNSNLLRPGDANLPFSCEPRGVSFMSYSRSMEVLHELSPINGISRNLSFVDLFLRFHFHRLCTIAGFSLLTSN